MDNIRNHKDVSRGVETLPIAVEKDIPIADVTDFVYVRYNIPGPGISADKFEHIFKGCGCAGKKSCDDSCTCISRFGKTYDKMNKLVSVDPYAQSMKPIYECNRACKCSIHCENRVVQNGVQVNLCVMISAEKGFGVQTLEAIDGNMFVCEYAGEVVSLEVARSRITNLRKDQPNYLLTLSEHGADDPVRTHVDPTYIGNVGRFINHSCQPNLYMVPVRVEHDIAHLALFAMRDIAAGEEITFDYSGIIQDCDNKYQDNRTKENVTEGKQCHCGSANCRGVLPFDEVLFTEQKVVQDKT